METGNRESGDGTRHSLLPIPDSRVSTPAELGFRMPPEWARHRGTWLSWPHRESSWPGRFEPVPARFAEIVRHLAPREEVHILAGDPELEASARRVLGAARVPAERLFFHPHPTDDAWCRDHGPIFLQREAAGRREELIVDWGFNAWGGKYPPFEADDAVPTGIAQELGLPVVAPGMVLEGGCLDGNGAGTLLTTECCVLPRN